MKAGAADTLRRGREAYPARLATPGPKRPVEAARRSGLSGNAPDEVASCSWLNSSRARRFISRRDQARGFSVASIGPQILRDPCIWVTRGAGTSMGLRRRAAPDPRPRREPARPPCNASAALLASLADRKARTDEITGLQRLGRQISPAVVVLCDGQTCDSLRQDGRARVS